MNCSRPATAAPGCSVPARPTAALRAPSARWVTRPERPWCATPSATSRGSVAPCACPPPASIWRPCPRARHVSPGTRSSRAAAAGSTSTCWSSRAPQHGSRQGIRRRRDLRPRRRQGSGRRNPAHRRSVRARAKKEPVPSSPTSRWPETPR